MQYILRMDEESLSNYWITFYRNENIEHWCISHVTEDGSDIYKIEGEHGLEPVEVQNIQQLIKKLQDLNVLKTNSSMLKPREGEISKVRVA